MIQNVHISGALDRAIFLKNGDYFVKKLDHPSVPVRKFDINTLLQFGGDIVVVEKTKEQELNQLIQDQSDLQSGLQLAIEGIAPRTPINDKFRQPTIELLEEYLADAPIYEFAHTRMMSKPVTEDTDIAEALRIAQAHQYTKAMQFYADLQAAQPMLQAFWTLWKEVTYAYFDTEQALIEVEDQLLENGTFAKINQRLHTAKTKKEADEIVFLVPQNLIRLFQKIAQQYTDRQGIKTKKIGKVSDISHEYEEEKVDQIEILLSEYSGIEQFKFKYGTPEKVNNQITYIENLIKENQLTKIDNALLKLTKLQLQHSGKEYLCQSMTNLATTAIKFNENTLAERLIYYAKMANPQDAAPFCQEAELFKTKNNLKEAEKLYKTVIQKFPNDVVAQNGLAEIYKAQNNFNDAEKLYKTIIEKFPNDVVAQTGLAEIYKAQNKFNDAEKLYKTIIEKFPNDVVSKRGLAEVYKAQNKFNDAEKLYKTIIEEVPNDVIARNGYLHTLILAEKYEVVEAIIKNETSTPVTHSDWIFHHTISMYYLKIGNLNEAIQRLKYGVKKSSVQEQSYYNTALAFALNKKGQPSNFQKALQHIEKYSIPVERASEFQLQQAIKALTHINLNQKEQAKKILHQLHEPATMQHKELIELINECIDVPPSVRPAKILKMEKSVLLLARAA